ncbi:MAG: UPF0182 family membrane protein [Actinomycetaceae bacterium]
MTIPPMSRPGRAAGAGSGSGNNERTVGTLALTIIIIGVLAALVFAFAQVWTELSWYHQVGYEGVVYREWGARAIFFVVGLVITAAVVLACLEIAYRSRKVYAPTTPEERNLDRYRGMIEPRRRLLFALVALLPGIFVGLRLQSSWRELLLWFNGQSFGVTDPEFGLDIGFFVFTLPAVRVLLSTALTVIVLGLVATIVAQYLYGGLSLARKEDRVSRGARVQLGVLAAVFALLLALSYWLDRYSLLVGNNQRFSGASYSDINAALPGRGVMAAIALLVAVMFIVAAVRGTWRLPAAGVAMMVVAAIVVGTAYPAIVQRFEVEPNAIEAESPYIQRNIEATRAAYGLDGVDSEPYEPTTDVERGQLGQDSAATTQIRLLDPNLVSPTFDQLQQIRQYYGFAPQLSVDRYELDGEMQDTVISLREVNHEGLSAEQRTWVNEHTVYTHGFGVVAAQGNSLDSDGRPLFFQQGIPSEGALGDYEPRVYFGQDTDFYSIVGAPEGTNPWELDYPSDSAPNGQVNSTFSGDGGPSIGNFLERAMFAMRFGDVQLMFSDRVTSESQILFHRDPHERVARVAPYLTLDSRAYPAVVDDDDDPETPSRLVWIIDGYTTSNDYPYSARESLEEATEDSLSEGQAGVAGTAYVPEQVNYIRNSVKAVVDAYDGSVSLYEWGQEEDENPDPILEAWQSVFPENNIEPVTEMSGDLMAHMRYPEDLFKVQRTLLSQYHVTDPATFYSGADFWNIPTDPTASGNGVQQPPFYLTLQMPGQDEATFSLSTAYIPGGEDPRNVLTGFVAVDSETGDTPGEVRDGYGDLRLIELPRNSTVPGPGQVQNNFNSSPEVSTELNLLRQGGSDVLLGNLLTLPVGGGLLYVQPVYVQSSGGTAYPTLQRVLVGFGDEIGFAPTLDEALDQIFEGESGAATSEGAGVESPSGGAEPEEPTGSVEVPAGAQQQLADALAEMQSALAESNEAMAAGDWAAYGEAQERLTTAIENALAAEAEIAGATGEDPVGESESEAPSEGAEAP